MASRSRMPPPSWIGTCPPTAAIMSRITFSFLGRPAMAPFRSTMWRRRAPSPAQCLAIATGSSENTVAEFMSPCFRRTQRPSFRSIAGMMSTAVLEENLGSPVHEVGEKLQAGGVAFFRVELDRKDIIPSDCTGKGQTVAAGRRGNRCIRRQGVIAVHEVEPAIVGDALPQRVVAHLPDRIPSLLRNLQPTHRIAAKARHAAAQYPQTGGIALLGTLEQHLRSEERRVGQGG